MTIRNKKNYMAQLWDWGFLDDCFGGTQIKVSDLDGIVERNGHFLVIEAKGPGAPVPQGQSIMFSQMAANPALTVLVVWGEPNKPDHAQVWGRERVKADEAKIKRLVSRWYQYANEG